MNEPHSDGLLQPADDSAARLHSCTHDAMGCTFGLLLDHADATYARQAARAAFDEIDRLECELSRFIPTSDVARLNAAPPDTPIHVSPDTIACLQLAAALHHDTNGAFDVTYRRPTTPHTEPALLLDPSTHAVGRRHADVTIDLGGIGKGYSLDCAIEVLHEWQIPRGLAHSGQSTLRAWPTTHNWRIAPPRTRQPEPHHRHRRSGWPLPQWLRPGSPRPPHHRPAHRPTTARRPAPPGRLPPPPPAPTPSPPPACACLRARSPTSVSAPATSPLYCCAARPSATSSAAWAPPAT